MWISKTIPFIHRHPTNHGIDMQPKSKSPNLFSTALSCWKGRDHFCLEAKALFFFAIRNWNNFKAPNLNSLVEADLWKRYHHQDCLKHKPIFCRKKRMGSFWQSTEKNQKKGPFLFQFLCTCKRGPKVRRTAAQYLESRKNKPLGMWFLTRGSCMFCVVFFNNNDSKIGIWDILTKIENIPPDKPLKTAATCNPHLRHSSTFGKGPGRSAFGMERCKSRSACNSWRRILGFRGSRIFHVFWGRGFSGLLEFFACRFCFFVSVHLNRWFHWMIMLHVLWYD